QLQNFAAHVHRNLASEITSCHSRCDFRDVSHLRCEVASHGVHRLGEVLPYTGDALNICLTAEFAVGTHFARDARYFRGEGVELVHHDVDGVLQLKNLSTRIHGDLRGKVTFRHRRGYLRDVAHL